MDKKIYKSLISKLRGNIPLTIILVIIVIGASYRLYKFWYGYQTIYKPMQQIINP